MSNKVPSVLLRETLPRIAADLAVIYLSMLLALGVSVAYQNELGGPRAATQILRELRGYYIQYFLLLAVVFPITFWVYGFYTHTRAYDRRTKTLSIVQGVGLGVMAFLTVSFLFFDHLTIGRSVALPFIFFAALGCSGTRLFKDFIEKKVFSGREDAVHSQPSAGEPRTLVIGGAGYIGSILVRELVARGKKVRVLDKLLYGAGPLREILDHPNVDFVAGDCRNISDVVSAMRGVTSLVHLAAIVGDPACEEDRQSALEVNYAATRMVLEIAKAQGVERFVFASSCSVYGASSYEVDESAETTPLSLYAQTKVDSERATLDAASESFHPTVLRFATVFGLGHRPRFDLVVNLLAAKAFQEGVITIYNGQQWRPFIHVRDAARAIVAVLDAPTALVEGEIFNAGDSNFNFTLTQIAEKIARAFPNTKIEHVDNNDRRDYRVSFNKIRSRLGFRCTITVDEGIAECIQAMSEKSVSDYREAQYHNVHAIRSSGKVTLNKRDIDTGVMAAFASPAGGEARRVSRP